MTKNESELLDAIKEMERTAPEVGLCSAPFTVLLTQVAQIIAEKDELLRTGADIKRIGSQLKDCRNELCLRCGNYKEAHKGACDGCRWKE